MSQHNAICSFASAAKLASIIKSKQRGGFNASIAYYQRAIRHCNDAYIKARLINEIALLYAYQKNPFALKKSREWYDRGFSLIQHIQNEKQRIHIEILLNNGLALVEYHDGNNMKALSLENYALSIAPKNPEIKEWALQLVNSNIAKLMIERFNDKKMGIYYLRKNLNCKLSYVQEHTRVELAKFYFDEKNYHEVVDLLGILYEPGDSKFNMENKEEEMLGRFIFTISLLAINEKKRAEDQLPFLRYLCDVFNPVGGDTMLEKIQACF